MPYRPDELEDLTIYTNFRDKLRSGYIKNIIQGALNKFRNKENFLLSYEDLDTGKGIESATFTKPLPLVLIPISYQPQRVL